MTQLVLTLGMPHLGRNNLSENALFKTIGNDRWSQIQELGGVPTALIQDDQGFRLYATFFFLELHLPPSNPLSAYTENDVLTFDTDIHHYDKVYLDGRHVLAGRSDSWVRTSNVFIYQERGPSKLSVSVPSTMDFAQIHELDAPPDSLELCRQAKTDGAFWKPAPEDMPLFEGKKEFLYKMDADRDLNGAGLVYFANFIAFLDLAERQILSGLPKPLPKDLLDARSPYRRRIGYFGNAESTDPLHISLAARSTLLPGPDGSPLLDLGMDYQIHRSSDGKQILVSSCRKVSRIEKGSDGERWVREMYGEKAV